MKTITNNDTNNTLASIQLNQVINQLTDLADYEIISIHNEYCDINNDSYNHIIDNDNEAIDSMFDSPSEAIRAATFGDYHSSHNYFILDGYANLVSFNYVSDDNSPIDISELAQWLISEDKLSDYDIEVTTLEDMLASIEDNITDDGVMLNKLTYYVDKSVFAQDALMVHKYNACDDFIIHEYMDMLSNYDYNQLNDIINYLGINHQ